jgi:hypothetical protein
MSTGPDQSHDVAAALYILGLLHTILTLVRRSDDLFRIALAAFGVGRVFHLVSIIGDGIAGAPSRPCLYGIASRGFQNLTACP